MPQFSWHMTKRFGSIKWQWDLNGRSYNEMATRHEYHNGSINGVWTAVEWIQIFEWWMSFYNVDQLIGEGLRAVSRWHGRNYYAYSIGDNVSTFKNFLVLCGETLKLKILVFSSQYNNSLTTVLVTWVYY